MTVAGAPFHVPDHSAALGSVAGPAVIATWTTCTAPVPTVAVHDTSGVKSPAGHTTVGVADTTGGATTDSAQIGDSGDHQPAAPVSTAHSHDPADRVTLLDGVDCARVCTVDDRPPAAVTHCHAPALSRTRTRAESCTPPACDRCNHDNSTAPTAA